MTGVKKHPFLVCYDYGMGGLWAIVDARSEAEILDKFPELTIVRERPRWMGDEEYEKIVRSEHHDIDGQSLGVLKVVLDDRSHD